MNEMNWVIQQGRILPIQLADPRFQLLGPDADTLR